MGTPRKRALAFAATAAAIAASCAGGSPVAPEPEAQADTEEAAGGPDDAGADLPSPNAPPVAADDFAIGVGGDSIYVEVLANDADPDGDALSLATVSAPRRGEASVVAGLVLYTPPPMWNGFDRLTYRIEDGRGGEAEATLFVTTYEAAEPGAPQVIVPKSSLEPEDVGVLYSTLDPESGGVATVWAALRRVPLENVLGLAFPTGEPSIDPDDFASLREEALAALPSSVEALALAWTAPWRVGCMGITSAFALGWDPSYCNTTEEPCAPTKAVPTYDDPSVHPRRDHGVLPAMMLAGETPDMAWALGVRGLAADRTSPAGRALLLRTTDEARSVRYGDMAFAAAVFGPESGFEAEYRDLSAGDVPDFASGEEGLLVHETGLASVPGVADNGYLPGALCDHLTSFGGVLGGPPDGQMSALAWLSAGCTATYGTVVEPCNMLPKFPRASVLLRRYYHGATALEAYWKSVEWPGEGVFAGDPLARPFGRFTLRFEGGVLSIRTTALDPGHTYALRGGEHPDGPLPIVEGALVPEPLRPFEIEVVAPDRAVYALEGPP